MLSLLRQRNFRFLWVAGFISLLGDWILYAVFPFYIARITGSALATGLMALTQLLPTLLLGTIAGVFVDRWNPRKTMIGTDLLRAIVLLVLLAMQSSRFFWLIYIVAFMESSISVFFGPAKTVMIRIVVSTEDLVPANSLSSISDNICRLAGPTIAGVLFLFSGLHILVFIDCASYFISALLLISTALPTTLSLYPEKVAALAEPTKKGKLSSTSFWQQWLEGVHHLYEKRWLMILCGCMIASMLGQGIFNALFPIFAEQIVRMNSAAYGWYLSAQGIGGLLGGFLIGKFGKEIRPIRLLAGSLAGTGLLFFFQFNFPLLPIALVTSATAGVFVVGWIVSLQTLLQSGVNKTYLGRIMSTYRTIQMGALLVGTSSGSLLGALWGIVPMLNLAASMLLLAALGCFLFRSSFESQVTKTQESIILRQGL